MRSLAASLLADGRLTASSLRSTPSTEPLFPATQPRRGTHISLIGSYKPHMREVAPELLSTRTGGVVYVDGADECRAEAGELEGFEGKLVEIGSLGGAGVVERQEDADLTVWKSVCRGQRWRVSTMGVRRLRPCFPLTLARRSASASRTLPSRTSSFGRARSSVSARSSRSEMATPCAATYVVSIGGSSFALVPAIARPPPPPPRPFVESRLSVD